MHRPCSRHRAAPAGTASAHAACRDAPRGIHGPARDRDRSSVGDIVVDVILAPAGDIERGSDVRGSVLARAGGSAATAARWLGRLGAHSTLVCAIGRDAAGRALVAAATDDGVTVRAVRVAGARTGRIGVLVEPDGQRSFVQDRGAALRLRPEDLKPDWFAGAEAVHLPGLLAARRAARPGRHGGDPAGPRGRRARHRRPRVHRAAAGAGPPARDRADPRGPPGPAVRQPRRGQGADGQQVRGAAARAGADRRRQARPQGRVHPRPRRTARPFASTSPRRRSRRPTRRGPAMPSMRASSWAGSMPGAAGSHLRRPCDAAPSPAIGRRSASSRTPARSSAWADGLASQPVDPALLALEVLELGRRPDVVGRQLVELVQSAGSGGPGRRRSRRSRAPAHAAARAGRARRAAARTSSRRRG